MRRSIRSTLPGSPKAQARKNILAPWGPAARWRSLVHLQVFPEGQAGDQDHPGHFAHQEAPLCQQPLEGLPIAGHPAAPRLPLAECDVQAAHAASV